MQEVFDNVDGAGSRRRHGGRRQEDKGMRSNLGRNHKEHVETPSKNAVNAMIALLVLVVSGLVVGIQFFQFEDKANTWIEKQKENKGELIFTKEILRYFDGSVEGRPIVVCIVGSCYNVSAGARFYSKGMHYACFAGNDGSRAYVTGKFDKEGCIDDLEGLKPGELITVDGWLKFYQNQTKYNYMGKLIGRYYDSTGEETEELKTFHKLVAQARHDEIFMKKLPACNIHLFPGEGTRIWCSSDSGGLDRHWTGLPRIERDEDTGEDRCVCVPPERLNENGFRTLHNCTEENHCYQN